MADAAALDWLAPDRAADPRAALQRIEALCGLHPTLFGALQTIVATHPAVPRGLLAQAVKRFRRDADGYTEGDVLSLLAAIQNGARDAFDAVVRTRRGAARKAAPLPFIRPD